MPEHQTDLQVIAPLFSIIIPLEYHRGQWERCWQGWQSQTLDHANFEIILVVPPDFPERDKLSELTGPVPHLEYSQHTTDAGLYAAGAARARGKFLFFTESHCWPEPDVLALCLAALQANADWAGLSCKGTRVTHNSLSEAEADMYERDIEFGMTVHPWRKILDACFVTRREAYDESGGFTPELGHFAEWVLAASYFECGRKVGYLPQARIHHYYIGSFAALKSFTLDFVEGEARYFSGGGSAPVSNLLEAPEELVCQDNFAAAMARGILRIAAQDIMTSSTVRDRRRLAISAIGRWVGPAMFGDGMARSAGAAAALYANLAALLAMVAGSREWLSVCFRRHIVALIHYQRLTAIRAERLRGGAANIPDSATGSGRAAILQQTGFYSFEEYQDIRFRWSENAAAIRITADAGRQIIRLKCLAVRKPAEIDVRFFLDGKRIPDHAVSTGAGDFEIRIDTQKSGAFDIGWICPPLKAVADPRRLGLPIVSIEVICQTDDGIASEVISRSHQM